MERDNLKDISYDLTCVMELVKALTRTAGEEEDLEFPFLLHTIYLELKRIDLAVASIVCSMDNEILDKVRGY